MKKLLPIAIISFVFFLASAVSVYAQTHTKIPRIGLLRAGAPPDSFLEIFTQGLRDLGYIDGKNVRMEVRFAEGKTDRIPDLAVELVRLKVDAAYAQSTPVILALKQATKTIPIVFLATQSAWVLSPVSRARAVI